MGWEKLCRADNGTIEADVKAEIESGSLIVRGAFRMRISPEQIRRVVIEGDDLLVEHSGGTVRLSLGPQEAAKWAHKLLHPPSLMDKLGVKPNMKAAVEGNVNSAFCLELEQRLETALSADPNDKLDLLFFGAEASEALGRLSALRARLKPNGAIWILRPKGISAITENDVMVSARHHGLVDVKVCRFSNSHTAEKLVIPRALRIRCTDPMERMVWDGDPPPPTPNSGSGPC